MRHSNILTEGLSTRTFAHHCFVCGDVWFPADDLPDGAVFRTGQEQSECKLIVDTAGGWQAGNDDLDDPGLRLAVRRYWFVYPGVARTVPCQAGEPACHRWFVRAGETPLVHRFVSGSVW